MSRKVNLYTIEQVQKYGKYCFMADVSKIKGNEVTWFECEYAAACLQILLQHILQTPYTPFSILEAMSDRLKNSLGKIQVKFFLWTSINISLVLSVLLKLIVNLFL